MSHIESRKQFEEDATERFMNPSATPTWPEGTCAEDYETPKETRDRVQGGKDHDRKESHRD